MKYPKFFWIGEESEIFVAESFEQLLADKGNCGSGIEVIVGGTPCDYFGASMEWGELDGSERLTVRDTDENERYCGTFTGNLHDIYARFDGGRHEMPVMLLSQYA